MSLALVTGAAGAMGQAITARLAEDGHDVVLIDIAERVDDVARGFGSRALACRADVATAAGAAQVRALVDDLGEDVAVLVNNAGINRDGRAWRLREEDFRAVVRVDLVGPLRLCDALEGRLADGASIVNIGSRAGLGNFGQANYVAAKSGLAGYTRALALRLAPRARVNLVAPGLIDTPMTAGMPEDVLDRLVGRIPAGRMGGPREVAEVVGFLAGPAADYVTGQFVPVCGGRSVG